MREDAKYVFPVAWMCCQLEVSKSGYYEWRHRPESATAQRRSVLTAQIKDIFEMSDSTYGYRRVHAQLRRNGVEVGLELVRYLMREAKLVPCQRKRRRVNLTDPAGVIEVPDRLGRVFTALAPGLKFVGDITYIDTDEGWLYLATVIDCCTKEVVGYSMADHYRTDLIIDAMEMARRDRRFGEGAIFHSDSKYEGAGCSWAS
jgi:putative transposase